MEIYPFLNLITHFRANTFVPIDRELAYESLKWIDPKVYRMYLRLRYRGMTPEARAAKLENPRLLQIHFHTLRHWKGTTEYHKTKDPYHVKRLLGHKSLLNTEIYINIEQAVFQTEDSEFHVKVAETLDEACKLLEVGFEYVADMDGKRLFRKRR
jgi:integrase